MYAFEEFHMKFWLFSWSRTGKLIKVTFPHKKKFLENKTKLESPWPAVKDNFKTILDFVKWGVIVQLCFSLIDWYIKVVIIYQVLEIAPWPSF